MSWICFWIPIWLCIDQYSVQEVQQYFQKVARCRFGRNCPTEWMQKTLQIQKIQLHRRRTTFGPAEFSNVSEITSIRQFKWYLSEIDNNNNIESTFAKKKSINTFENFAPNQFSNLEILLHFRSGRSRWRQRWRQSNWSTQLNLWYLLYIWF